MVAHGGLAFILGTARQSILSTYLPPAPDAMAHFNELQIHVGREEEAHRCAADRTLDVAAGFALCIAAAAMPS
jgi:hypothetical protein